MRLAIAFFPIILAHSEVFAFGDWDQSDGRAEKVVIRDEVRPVRDALAPLIEAAQERFSIPAISLCLVNAQYALWCEGFGHADQETERAAGPHTLYRAGSLAKPVTAIAVMQLAEQDMLDIDQPLNAYLTEFSIRSRFDTVAKPITVRNVLSHHAGLPTDLNKGMWTAQSYTGVVSALRDEYAAFPPELVFSYSNVGYTLLGHMVEQVAGKSYVDYVRQRILDPVGMRASRMAQVPPDIPDMAKGYREGRPSPPLPIRDLPAYGLHTSAADLGRLLRAILAGGAIDGKRILDKGTLEEMFEPQNHNISLDLDIVNGLGWFMEHGSIPDAGAVVRHGGTTLSFGGEVIVAPEKGLAVVVLANAEGSRGVTSKLGESILSRVIRSNADMVPTDIFITQLEKEVKDFQPAEMSGNYATDFGLISIRPKDAKLCACIVEETFDLIPYPNGWFGIGESARGSLPPSFRPLTEMRFQTQQVDGREVVVAKKGEKRIVLGEKIPPAPVPDSWLKRIGSYEVTNQDEGFPLVEPELKLQDGQLCMSYKLPRLSAKTIQVPLRPISDTEAIILGLGRTRGETLRIIHTAGEERLRYSGFVGKKVSGDGG